MINRYHFEKLTPINNLQPNIYTDAIEFALKDDEIKNVAISGAYSSGKSSVFLSYENRHKEKNVVHISLADFMRTQADESGKVPSDGNNKEDNSILKVLEGRIINQIIHQIDETDIPQTNFNLKSEFSFKKTVLAALQVVMFCISSLLFFKFNFWKQLVDGIAVGKWDWLDSSWVNMCAGIVVCVLFARFLFVLFKMQKLKSLFKRITIKGSEVELFGKSEDLVFDKHLGEIIYLLKQSKAEIVVFEDIDRFNNNQIFARLREINSMINKSFIGEKSKEKKVIKFVYLLRDDMFESKDRTKFFDFIIPVIPVIDSSNSYDKLVTIFEKVQGDMALDDVFLRNVSYFIDDMRLLKNIYNEFVIYFEQLKKNNPALNPNKLLSMIIYKNLYPGDFIGLQNREGFVKDIFEFKETVVTDLKENINSKLIILQEEIKQIENEHLEDEKELFALYFDIAGKNISVNRKYLKDIGPHKKAMEMLKNYLDNEPDKVKVNGSGINKESLLAPLTNNPEYQNRLTLINQKSSNAVINKKQEIYDLTKRKQMISSYPLSLLFKEELLETYWDDFFVKYTKYKKLDDDKYFPLIKSLMELGYIDEYYSDYMTYFYSKSLSNNDKQFLMSVIENSPKSYTYQIQDINRVVNELKMVDFSRGAILNYSLFGYLIKYINVDCVCREYLIECIGYIIKHEMTEFLLGFYDQCSEEEKQYFIIVVASQWKDFIRHLESNNYWNEEQKHRYYLDIFKHLNSDHDLFDKEGYFVKKIQNMEDFLSIDAVEFDLVSKMEETNVCLEIIDGHECNKDLLKAVCEKECFVINSSNILVMLRYVYAIPGYADYINENYTLIAKHKDSALYKYVNSNMETYMREVVLKQSDSIRDDEFAVLEILNHKALSFETKKEYVSNLKTLIKNAIEIENQEVFDVAFDNNIEHNENNLLASFIDFNKDISELVTWIDEYVVGTFDSTLIDENYFEKEDINEFLSNVIKCNEINIKAYQNVIRSLKECVDDDFEDITNYYDELDTENYEVLIDEKIIDCTLDNVEFFRTRDMDLAIRLVYHNIDTYKSLVYEVEEINQELLHKILVDEDISVEDKVYFATINKEYIGVDISEYDVLVNAAILDKWHNLEDVKKMYPEYAKLPKIVQEALIDATIYNINEFVKLDIDVSKEIYLKLVTEVGYTDEVKEQLLKKFLKQEPTNEEVSKFLEDIQENDLAELYAKGPTSIRIYKPHSNAFCILKDAQYAHLLEEHEEYDNYLIGLAEEE